MTAKIVLFILGVSFIVFGLWALLAPASMADLIHFGLTDNLATTEMRAFYGGVELGLGLFLLLGALRPDHTSSALTAAVLILGLVAVSRLFGIILDGSRSNLMFGALATEVAGLVLSLWALKSHTSTQSK